MIYAEAVDLCVPALTVIGGDFVMTLWFWIQTIILAAIAWGYFSEKLPDKFAEKLALLIGGDWDDIE